MAWRVEVERAAAREIDELGRAEAQRVLKFLRRVSKLDDPRSIGEALRGARLGALWKYRVGDYRIIADIQDDVLVVLVVRVGHRREVYRR